jgi:uncharacterized protein
MKRASHWSAVFLFLLCRPLWAQEEQKKPEPPKAVDFTWGVKIPMRDRVKLNATVYRPKDQKEALPIIFELTPYISDTYHNRAYYFAQHGYVFVIVDVRGRGNSQGDFDPFMQDPQDGYDVVEWLAQQPWRVCGPVVLIGSDECEVQARCGVQGLQRMRIWRFSDD